MLKFEDKDWRFVSPGALPPPAVWAILDLVNRVTAQGDQWNLVERFKKAFAGAAGEPYHASSNASWASSDLERYATTAAENAPNFIAAFVSACSDIHERDPDIGIPNVQRINAVLAEHAAGFEIRDEMIKRTSGNEPVAVPERTPSLDQQAQHLIQDSLATAERQLAAGNGRGAVQELLWLLETITTAFRGQADGDQTIQGKYFNKIVGELRKESRGSARKNILEWMTTLHGFLSSPTGGGVRHGMDPAEGVAVDLNEAKLYCNLIRSYLSYLIGEHERLFRNY